MKQTKLIGIVISLMALILFSGCSYGEVDVEELGIKFCKDSGYSELTDYRGSLNINAKYNYIKEFDGKRYIQTGIDIECDNEHRYKSLDYYDPKKQFLHTDSYGSILRKTSTSKCVARNKWGECTERNYTYPEGEPRLVKRQ